jgi:hypothetical protein
MRIRADPLFARRARRWNRARAWAMLLVGMLGHALALAQSSAADADKGSQFFVVPYPITEPAVGNGLLAGPVWMRAGPTGVAGPSKPQAFGAGALWTDEGSRGLFAFDHRAWDDGKWQTTAIGARVDLDLRYPGLLPGSDRSVGFTLHAKGGSVEGERLLGEGPASVIFKLFSGTAEATFREPPAELTIEPKRIRIVGTTLAWSRDTRDDIFSPSTGQAILVGATIYPESLGAGFDAQRVSFSWMGYHPGPGAGVFGLRTQADASFGRPPFYLRPYISLRGVPALRYPGEQVASAEAEYRYPIGPRWSVLAFGGIGAARADIRGFTGKKTVSTIGLGFRVKMKKLFGLTLGIDVAQGPDGSYVYFQVGNPWTK